MEYRIFPSVGLARIGNSPSFFVGPEVLGSRGRDLGAAGETEVTAFKDASFRVRKQAARFHLFQRATPAEAFVPAMLPNGARLRWAVHLANKKDGIVRPSSPPMTIPAGGLRPTPDPTRANRQIDSGRVSVEGTSAPGISLQGTHVGVVTRLGELRTDPQGRLLVLGADGISRSNPPSAIGGDFYTNRNWHDDVADGPVSAEVILSDGTIERAEGAWVVVGPPDFAKGSQCIVTLYDIMEQLAVSQGWLSMPTVTSFTKDVYPLLRRARSLRWAHGRNSGGTVISEPRWSSVSEDFARLASASAADKPFRIEQKGHIFAVESILLQFRLTTVQRSHLDRWGNGMFISDWTGIPPIDATPTSAELTRVALGETAGQGFFPGIEGGRILTDPTIYHTAFDFRIDHTKLAPGDVTALMAQPWQADFLKCQGNWWPSQRPDIAPQGDGSFKMWARLGAAEAQPNHQQLVDHAMQFGVITPRVVAGVEVCVEEGRNVAAAGP